MNAKLDELAEFYGIALSYLRETGEQCHASENAKQGLLEALGVAADSDEAIHSSLIHAQQNLRGGVSEVDVPRCFLPKWLEDGRAWGIMCQLYSLRSLRNWGIGDFEDLAKFVELAGSAGADFVGVNPLHALFSSDPNRFSPYSPSSRRFLNTFYIAVDKIENNEQHIASYIDVGEIQKVRESELVDYEAVARLKRVALERSFIRFCACQLGTGSDKDIAFKSFCDDRGETLKKFALFEALSEEMVRQGFPCGWHGWPDTFKDPNTEVVRTFCEEKKDRVLFHMWLQWIADQQLENAQQRALSAGMRIGLYLDLAVGVAPDGADTWFEPEIFLRGIRIGSPPDALNAQGQDWGLAPLSPIVLREDNGSAFGSTLQESMLRSGAIRIDHVMSLNRLYLIADGLDGSGGAYVHYPMNQTLQVLAAISHSTQTLVIGEDLGTVPANFRDIMKQARVQRYLVLFFEREEGRRFRAPSYYSKDALACISTHDLPTLRGWWIGLDIKQLGQFGIERLTYESDLMAQRIKDRQQLLSALADEALLPDELYPAARGEELPPDELTNELIIALHKFLARTPCRLVAVQIEDLAKVIQQINVPGTVGEHPNWRRKLPLAISELKNSSPFLDIIQAVASERPRSI